MKLSNLHPCNNCGGKLGTTFYVVRMSIAVEVVAPDSNVVKVAMDDSDFKELAHQFLICSSCYTQELCLAEMGEKASINLENSPVIDNTHDS